MKIALLEPDPGICEMLSLALEFAGHTATSVDCPHDVLLCDLGFPGSQTSQHVLELACHSTMPVVLMSCTPRRGFGDALFGFDAVPFLEKPFHLADLFATLARVAPLEALV